MTNIVQGEEAREGCCVVGGDKHRSSGSDYDTGIVSSNAEQHDDDTGVTDRVDPAELEQGLSQALP